MNCMLCESGHLPTKKVYLPLVDPKTGIPTGEQIVLSSKVYNQILATINTSMENLPCTP